MPIPLSVMPLSIPSTDVVIPVYNAPQLTRCIDSVVACLGRPIEHIYIQDDASRAETREMLDTCRISISMFITPRKTGAFGASVNEAIKRSSASCVLVLNSEVEVSEDFLPPLYAALAADSQLAAIIPAGNDYAKHDLDQYFALAGRLHSNAPSTRPCVPGPARGFSRNRWFRPGIRSRIL